ncbi:MAG: type II secretion system secretin GspD [Sphingomonadaceae bacterium]
MNRTLIAASLALALASPLSAQQTLNLRDADIRAFIQDAARVTGRNLIIDSRVQGKVSVVTDRPLSKSEYFEVFLSTLRANGFIAVPTTSGGYRIQPVDTAATQPGRIGSQGASRNTFVTEVFRLRSIEAASAVETLRPLVSREGSVTANRAGNSLVVADFADNIRRIRTLLGRIDSDSAATEVIPLKNAGAAEITTSLQQLATGGQTSGSVSVVAIASSNSIALRGDARTVARFAGIARDLDRRAASGTEIRVIWLKHADAERLLPVLQQLVGQAVTASASASSPSPSGGGAATPAPAPVAVAPSTTSATPSANGRSAPVIARYEGANAIIISAPTDVQNTLRGVIDQLDTRREQVLVEAIIIEISDTAARRLGVQLLLGSTDGSAPILATNYSNTAPNLLTIAGALGARQLDRNTVTINGTTTTTTTGSGASDQLAQAALGSITGALGGLGGFATNIGKNGLFGAIINAVSQDNKSNILSTPSVLTLDNQEAKFLVGQEIPVTTGQQLGNNFQNAFRTVQRQNVGIQLEVKPQINAGGSIKLYIRQEVSSIAGAVSNSDSDLILNKREIQTTVTIDDGQIVALGGLLDDNERRTIEKIPLLGDIPAIGQLFRSKSKSRAKTNLMIFIRPTILKTADDARDLAERRYGYARDLQLSARPGEEPSLDQLVRDYMGAQPPIPDGPDAPGAALSAPGAKAPEPPVIIKPEVRQSTIRIQPVDIPQSESRP